MAATQCALHLSRLAEELIIWASQPFGFVRLPDAYSAPARRSCRRSATPTPPSWSAAIPGRIAGAMVALVMTMKGLPLAYSKDMQDDKPPVFEAHDLLMLSLQALAGMVEATRFDAGRMRAAAEAGFATATDLADWLVREAGVPFREAHHVVGRAVQAAEEARRRAGRSWSWRRCGRSTRGSTSGSTPSSPSTPRSRSRTSYGGTAPERVREQIERAKKGAGVILPMQSMGRGTTRRVVEG